MLLDEGMPVEEIQRLCDVHVAIFRDGLERQTAPQSADAHPISIYHKENRAAARLLEELRETMDSLQNDAHPGVLEKGRTLVERLQEYDLHFLRKEVVLFPYLEKHGFMAPSVVMWGIHNDVRSLWKNLSKLLAEELDNLSLHQIKEIYSKLENTLKEMFYKEEKILFPAAIDRLSQEEWRQVYAQERDMGFCYIQPVGEPLPAAAHAQQAEPAASTNGAEKPQTVALDCGALTYEQINLMLGALPVDVTFVDENDTVQFFSQTPERIFPRSPAIIGRKVQNCHPPQSLERVQKIIDDFRGGRSSVAEFWIQMQGKFIHIRYFALRDKNNDYKGVLEVSQDITHIRSLSGEKRL